MSRYQGCVGLIWLTLASAGFAEENIHVIIKYKEKPTLTSLKSNLSDIAHLPVESLSPIAGGAYSLIYKTKNLTAQAKNRLLDNVLDNLKNDPKIAYAVEDRVGHFKPLPTLQAELSSLSLLSHETQWDEFSSPGGVRLESAAGRRDGAWAYTTGRASNPIVVAVLDTGVALNDSLVNNLVKDPQGAVWGWNFAANNRDIRDETGSYHGTHVAGTIAGYGDVMMGMGEELKVLVLKIPDGSGMFYESQVINAMYWSVGGEVPGIPTNFYPAKVLNMSFGVDERPGKEKENCDAALQEAVSYVREKGAVLVAAAGNDNHWEHFNAPASCNGTMKIAATGPAGLRSYYSNYGPSVSFAAPGGDLRYGKQGAILSTVNPGGGYQRSGFDFYQGTSMATPHVAGVAGLVFAMNDGYIQPQQVEQILYYTTHGFGNSKDENESCVNRKPCGHGILDAENAVKATIAQYDVISSAPKMDDLHLVSCGQGDYQATRDLLNSGKMQWRQIKKSCESEINYATPKLTKTMSGKIIVNYGSVSYQLDDSLLTHCEIIGYDGIGCHF